MEEKPWNSQFTTTKYEPNASCRPGQVTGKQYPRL